MIDRRVERLAGIKREAGASDCYLVSEVAERLGVSEQWVKAQRCGFTRKVFAYSAPYHFYTVGDIKLLQDRLATKNKATSRSSCLWNN